MLCEAQTILSSLTYIPNKQSGSPFETPFRTLPQWEQMFCYIYPRLLLMNTLANTGLGITALVVRQVQPFRVIFTLVKYSVLFQAFRTIGENRDGESMMSDAKFR